MAMSTPQKMSLNISQATPTRDRTQPLRSDIPSSQFSSPTTLRTAHPSSSVASPNPSSSTSANAVSATPLSVDTLLAAHASASNPPVAALDAAVADRNTLAAQNAQLWKLIEKQRAGYSQLMKELERVRGEREAFRSKLNGLGENPDALLKAHREKERREGKDTLRSAASHTHLRSSESSGSSNNALDPRAHMARIQSDDNATRSGPRNPNGSARDHTTQAPSINGRERQNSQTSINAHPSSSQLSATYLSVSQTSSTTNLSISPTTSIPQSASSSTASLNERQAVDTVRKPSPLHLGTARSDSLPSATVSTPGGSSAPAYSFPPNTANVARNAEEPVLGSWNSPYSSRGATTPLSRTAQPSSAILLTPAPASSTTSRLNCESLSSVSSSLPLNAAIVAESSLGPITNLNGILQPPRPQPLSRESRISLPEEAKRYYASMVESPIPSPGTGQHPNPSLSSPNKATNGVPEFSDSPPPIGSHYDHSVFPDTQQQGEGLGIRSGRASGEDGGEFLELDDEDSTYESTAGDELTEHSGDPEDDDDEEHAEQPRDSKMRAVVEDFPLPPSTPPTHPGGDTFTQAQMQAIALQRLQSERGLDDSLSQYSGITSDSHTLVDGRPAQRPPVPPTSPLPISHNETQMKFRALPLLASDLPRTQIVVSHSSIRPNDRGKEVLSFVITVHPAGKEPWKIEKMYSDVLTLDSRVRATLGKTLIKKLVNLPEGRMWKDHAPAKVDQRKIALELYLRSLIALPVKNKDEIVAFFTSDVVREAQKPVSQAGYKEGYLTKRGKNFGGWKARYFVLQGPSLEYYESRGGTHLGSIVITGAQIGRQQRPQVKQQSDEDNEYRHAFLIIEAKKGPGGSHPRHVLCAQSDRERDDWVEELVRYVTGTYNDEEGSVQDEATLLTGPGRSSTSSDLPVTPNRRPRKDDSARGPAVPMSQLPPDFNNARLFHSIPAPSDEPVVANHSPVKSTTPQSYIEHRSAALGIETPLSTSLPSSSPLTGGDDTDAFIPIGQRANSEMGHYPDLADQQAEISKARHGRTSPDGRRRDKRRSLNPLRSPPIAERGPSPEKESDPHTPRVDAHGKVKISGPMNGTPIPAGYKFGGKDGALEPSLSNERREKAKSRTFWGFGRQHEKANMPTHIPRAVFGVSLEESLDVAQIASLPAIVFRCIQYLEANKAEQEEGIYRLSGSSAVIKALKDRFNVEGDVDLLASDEYWDPHAIAGLLKTFLRELPASILTRDLHLRFLSVIDFVDAQERITELSHLIASLPVANYSLLRALTAHLILIVQNANVNKMTMRNVGIVFSPTLGIPAGVFSLMLGEFKRVFNVDGTLEEEEEGRTPAEGEDPAAELSRRNSRHYSDAAADTMLGLSGRVLSASSEGGQSDEGEDVSLHDDSGTEDTYENDSIVDSSATSSSAYLTPQENQMDRLHPSDNTPNGSGSSRSHASFVAASRGLNIAVSDKASRRQSRVIGLPHSPRPHPPPNSTLPSSSPRTPNTPKRGGSPHSPTTIPVSPLHTPK